MLVDKHLLCVLKTCAWEPLGVRRVGQGEAPKEKQLAIPI